MASEEAFRRAVLADVIENPADDVPRLMFADWLEEHDDPKRAEFIRLQIELARKGWEKALPSNNLQGALLCHRERELRREGWRSWSGELLLTLPDAWWSFSRGFVVSVELPKQVWLDHGPALVLEAPLESVRLPDVAITHNFDGMMRWYVLDLPVPLQWPGYLSVGHNSPNSCLEAVSRRCLEWARTDQMARLHSITGR